MIILEGFDGAGKSTLGRAIGWGMKHAGGPPKNWADAVDCMRRQRADLGQDVIWDRVTCISHQVYDADHLFDETLMDEVYSLLNDPSTVLIYCRPPDKILMDFSRHKISPHDTEEHVRFVQDNMENLISAYDALMDFFPHIKYDYTTVDLPTFIEGVKLVAK